MALFAYHSGGRYLRYGIGCLKFSSSRSTAPIQPTCASHTHGPLLQTLQTAPSRGSLRLEPQTSKQKERQSLGARAKYHLCDSRTPTRLFPACSPLDHSLPSTSEPSLRPPCPLAALLLRAYRTSVSRALRGDELVSELSLGFLPPCPACSTALAADRSFRSCDRAPDCCAASAGRVGTSWTRVSASTLCHLVLHNVGCTWPLGSARAKDLSAHHLHPHSSSFAAGLLLGVSLVAFKVLTM